MNWWAVVTVLAIIGLASIALAHRPVTVYVWARDVSVCASVAVDPGDEDEHGGH